MATREQVNQLRLMADYHETDPYDDTQLSAMIDSTSVNRAAERLWTEKAATLAKMVDIAESGSSRRMGDLGKNALAMASYFRGLAEADDSPVDSGRFAQTRAAVREG